MIRRLLLIAGLVLGIAASGLVAPATAAEEPTDLTSVSAQIAQSQAQMADPLVQAEARKMLASGAFTISSSKTKKADPASLSIGGCGFLRNCIYFNRTEQRYIFGGSSAAVGAAICLAGTPAACVVAAAVIGVANVYINDRGGICSGSLRVQWFPYPGRPDCE